MPTATVPGMTRSRILYDRDCAFCRFTLALLLAWDARGALEPVPLESDTADRLLAGMSPDERMASWHLVAADGAVTSAGAAFAPLLRSLPAGAPAAWVAARAPAFAERGYRWVADRRSPIGRALPAAAKRWADRRIAGRERAFASHAQRSVAR
jgi:predicted DCC family thiol-disulfide oxidoreductase YuxK